MPYKSSMFAVTLALSMAVAVSGCGSKTVSTTADNGTTIAAEACNQALAKQTGMSDDAIVARDKATADEAAKAAAINNKWQDLAKATSDWAVTRQDLGMRPRRFRAAAISHSCCSRWPQRSTPHGTVSSRLAVS
jgi:hypothetical protein